MFMPLFTFFCVFILFLCFFFHEPTPHPTIGIMTCSGLCIYSILLFYLSQLNQDLVDAILNCLFYYDTMKTL